MMYDDYWSITSDYTKDKAEKEAQFIKYRDEYEALDNPQFSLAFYISSKQLELRAEADAAASKVVNDSTREAIMYIDHGFKFLVKDFPVHLKDRASDITGHVVSTFYHADKELVESYVRKKFKIVHTGWSNILSWITVFVILFFINYYMFTGSIIKYTPEYFGLLILIGLLVNLLFRSMIKSFITYLIKIFEVK